MKRKYVLVIEFSATVGKRIRMKNRVTGRYYKKLLKELMKNEKKIFEVYRLWLMTDLCFGNQIFEFAKENSSLKDIDELEIIMPVIESLAGDVKEYFDRILAMNLDRDDMLRQFDKIFDRFGPLVVEKANFMQKRVESAVAKVFQRRLNR